MRSQASTNAPSSSGPFKRTVTDSLNAHDASSPTWAESQISVCSSVSGVPAGAAKTATAGRRDRGARREDADRLKFVETGGERGDDRVDVGIAVLRPKEAREAFLHVDSAQPQMVVQQVREPVFVREVEVKQTAVRLDPRRDATRGERLVQASDEPLRALRDPLLQPRALGLATAQNGQHGGHRERMAHERAGEERGRDLGERVVAVLPRAAVERVHEARRSGKDADRQTAADDLAVRREIGADAEERLHAAGMHAETGDDLVEDERAARRRRDAAQFAQEFLWAQAGMAALHRLDDDGGEFVLVLANPREALGFAVRQNRHVRDGFGSGCPRRPAANGASRARS